MVPLVVLDRPIQVDQLPLLLACQHRRYALHAELPAMRFSFLLPFVWLQLSTLVLFWTAYSEALTRSRQQGRVSVAAAVKLKRHRKAQTTAAPPGTGCASQK